MIHFANRRKSRKSVSNASPQLSYSECVKCYFSETLLHGYRYVTEPNRSKLERGFWTVFVVMMIASMSYVVIEYYLRFVGAPTATSQQPVRVPISKVPFPAVLICPGSRLNKTALQEMTKDILNMYPIYPYEAVYNGLMYFTSFYTMEIDLEEFYQLNDIHNIVQALYNGSYTTQTVMSRLTPDCMQYIRRCKWKSFDVNCTDIFQRTRTEIGTCCGFNLVRRTDSEVNRGVAFNASRHLFVKFPGHENGLTVELDPRLEEAALSLGSNDAFSVFITDPQLFGAETMQNFPIDLKREQFFSVMPRIITGDDSMRDVSPKIRGCFFYDEEDLIYQDFYSFQECTMICKIMDIAAQCGCTPIQYVNALNTSRCTLIDLPCLNNWKKKWDNTVPTVLDENHETTVFQCPKCLPSCSYTNYYVYTSSGYLKNFGDPTFSNDTEVSNEDPFSVVHVSFGKAYVTEYKQSLIYSWYEMMSIFGNLCAIVIGASIISLAEITWFLTGKFGLIWFKKNKISPKNPCWVFSVDRFNNRRVSEAQNNNQEGFLYWEEFQHYI